MENNSNRLYFFVILTALLLLFTISLVTQSIGDGDPGDYAGVAKFFAGKLHSNIRSSHSYMYGFLHHPLVLLTNSFFALKVANLIYLVLLILSVYYASRRNRNVLLLLLFSPVIWYSGPWISPIVISSLLFFWAYYAIKEYDSTRAIRYLVVTGMLAGLAWCFWDAMLFFIIIFGISFLYNKKLIHSVFFLIFVILGLLPKLIMDQFLFGSFAAGVLRGFFATFAGVVWKGIYGTMQVSSSNLSGLIAFISVLLLIPFFTYALFFSKENWSKIRNSLIFILLSLCLILVHSQIRYLLMIVPIIILETTPSLNLVQLRKHLILSVILILFIVTPYIIQIKYNTNADEFRDFLEHLKKGDIRIDNLENALYRDLDRIKKEHPNQVFVVGNPTDAYLDWFLNYWGKGITFVSIQDYQFWQKQESVLFSKTYSPKSNIQNRREIWISGGLSKNSGDKTDYDAIKYAICANLDSRGDMTPCKQKELELREFEFVRAYNKISLFEKKEK